MNPSERISSHLRGLNERGDFPEITKWMEQVGNSVNILGGNNNSPIVNFSPDGILLGNTGERIIFPGDGQHTGIFRQNTLLDTLQKLKTQKLSLNHVGIGYTVKDFDTEIGNLVEQMKRSVHTIYEDPAGREEQMRWLFIGDNTSENPMCEVVLTDSSNYTRPHMQFDIDTDLSPEEIEEKMEKAFGKGFLDWHLDIPEVGRVLSMGTYENTNIDMRIGVGTNLRSPKVHRETMIKIS